MRRPVTAEEERDTDRRMFALADPAIEAAAATQVTSDAVRPLDHWWSFETIPYLEPAAASVTLLGAPDVEVIALHNLVRVDSLRKSVPFLQNDTEYRGPKCFEDEREWCVIRKGKTPKEVLLGCRFRLDGVHEDLQSFGIGKEVSGK